MLKEIGIQDRRSGLASGEEHNKLLAKVHRYLQDMRGMLGVKVFFFGGREERGRCYRTVRNDVCWLD